MSRLAIFTILVVTLFASCKSGGVSLVPQITSSDETAEAGKIVAEANQELTEIKVLYQQNESKREELRNAMEKDDAAAVKRIANEVVDLINSGTAHGQTAIDKIQTAREMQINDDYAEYLRLKQESLRLELEAFENYRQAARTLRDNYDPKNTAQRNKVKQEFTKLTDNYRMTMEKARSRSREANEVAKAALNKQNQQ
ncbi:MAG TPA: hypothetical protein PKA82_00315 [Pyrinomonadaceae bacterium]|nr:hypothetical protein [Pyrinomonadaceae bacterium]